jgi:tetratricopeptide (TPR) repeat protein
MSEGHHRMKYLFFSILIAFIVVSTCNRNTPKVIKDPYELGIALASEGQFEKAANVFKQAMNASMDKRSAQESLAVVESVLSGSMDNEAAVNFFKGISFANNGEFLQAYSYLSKTIRIAPDFSGAYYERGSVNGNMNYYEKAIEDFTKAAELNPIDAPAFNNRGLAYAKGFNDYKKAIADFSIAIELNPQFAEAYENRGIAFMKKEGKQQEACADWKRACDMNKCNSYNLAVQNGYCK